MSCSRWLAAACLLLAACQPLPRPFQPDDKAELKALMRHVEVRPEADPAVVLNGVDGAPSDGDLRLAAAMRQALGEAGVRLLREPDGTAPLLLGEVHLGPAAAGMRRVEVTWTLVRPSGEEVGRVGQAEALPATMLEGTWGGLAEVIARAGAPGVLDLLEIAAAPPEGRVYSLPPRK